MRWLGWLAIAAVVGVALAWVGLQVFYVLVNLWGAR